jgi:hypothetical protein
MSSYNILLMQKNSELKKIGSITTSETSTNIFIIPTVVRSVNIFNQNILQIISNNPNNLPIIIPGIEDIEGKIFKILRFRKCTVYLIEQNSINGIRFLAYFSDKIMHYGECFGTSVEYVTKQYILEEISNVLKLSPELIEDNFGI